MGARGCSIWKRHDPKWGTGMECLQDFPSITKDWSCRKLFYLDLFTGTMFYSLIMVPCPYPILWFSVSLLFSSFTHDQLSEKTLNNGKNRDNKKCWQCKDQFIDQVTHSWWDGNAPQLIYRYNAIPVRNPARFIAGIGKLVLKFI